MISKTERDSLLNFPAPAIIIDSENVIVWYNRLLADRSTLRRKPTESTSQSL